MIRPGPVVALLALFPLPTVAQAALSDATVTVWSNQVELRIAEPANPTRGQTGCEIRKWDFGTSSWVVLKPMSAVYRFTDRELQPATRHDYIFIYRNAEGVWDAAWSPTLVVTTRGSAAAPAGLPQAGAADPTATRVTVAALDPTTREGRGAPGRFRLTRAGDESVPLKVLLKFGGSAREGVDYAPPGGDWIIPKGWAFLDILIRALADDLREGREEVVLTVEPAPGYVAGAQARARLIILDGTSLPPPTNQRVTFFLGVKADIVWDASPARGVAGYNLYRKAGPEGEWMLVNTWGLITETRFCDEVLQRGVSYSYRVETVGD